MMKPQTPDERRLEVVAARIEAEFEERVYDDIVKRTKRTEEGE
jgi:hypothetical protein